MIEPGSGLSALLAVPTKAVRSSEIQKEDITSGDKGAENSSFAENLGSEVKGHGDKGGKATTDRKGKGIDHESRKDLSEKKIGSQTKPILDGSLGRLPKDKLENEETLVGVSYFAPPLQEVSDFQEGDGDGPEVGAQAVAGLQPVVDFLKAMEMEFGLDPESVVHEMGRLQREELLLSPTEGGRIVLERLGLKGDDLERAFELYQGMLRDAAALAAEKDGQAVDDELIRPVETVESRPARVKELSNRFFAPETSEAPQKSLSQETTDDLAAKLHSMGLTAKVASGPRRHPEPEPQPQNVPRNHVVTIPGLQERAPIAEGSPVSEVPKTQTAQIHELSASQQIVNVGERASVVRPEAHSHFNEFGERRTAEGSVAEDSFFSRPSQGPSTGYFEKVVADLAAANKVSQPVELPQLDGESQVIKDIVQRAEILASRGGGQMKMQLHPKDMGEIGLDVRVFGGRVEVHVITETKKAKELFESGLKDLRFGMERHKLTVDTVKVDLASSVQKEFDEMHDQANREFARQFLGDLRQERQELRSGWTGIPSRPRRSGGRDPEHIRPEPLMRSARENGRIHLVA